MPSDPAIEVRNVGKAYRIWESPTARLTSPLLSGMARLIPGQPGRRLSKYAESLYRDFQALQEVSFVVHKGEAVGIIGRNGSGKSTLLQIIARTLQPTTGTIEVRGRVAALLELGSGFNPDFTGRENIYLYAAVLGLSRRQVDEQFDAIASFADIGNFIDQPVKTYSSGMQLRVAFAIATSVQPDILIIDEALSVGDIFFQQKAVNRIRQIIETGTTFLLVSHDPAAIRNLSRWTVLLNEGRVSFVGAPEEAVARYFLTHARGPQPPTRVEPDVVAPARRRLPPGIRQRLLDRNVLAHAKNRVGERRLSIAAASVGLDGTAGSLSGPIGAKLEIEIFVQAHETVEGANVNIHLHDRFSNLIFAASSQQAGLELDVLESGDEIALRLAVVLCIQPGQYTFDLGVGLAIPDKPNSGLAQDRFLGLGPVTIFHDPSVRVPFHGMAQLPMNVSVIS